MKKIAAVVCSLLVAVSGVAWAADVPDWFKGKENDPESQFLLGLAYYSGEDGVTEDKAKAIEWFTKAAEAGQSDAQYGLALMYDEGDGVPEDNAKAIEWYTKAALAGNNDAQFNLALMYDEGDGVPEDNAKAVMWYTKAAENGNGGAQYNQIGRAHV